MGALFLVGIVGNSLFKPTRQRTHRWNQRGYTSTRVSQQRRHRWRVICVALSLMVGLVALLWRMVDLAIFHHDFLIKQSRVRTLRIVKTPAHRGMILDRRGVPLAISTPLDSVWINPKLYKASRRQQAKLAQLLGMSAHALAQRIHRHSEREFVYLKRNLLPDVARQLKALALSGLFFQREYRRYYPQGEMTAHVLGLTNIDDRGQEGLELAYDSWLRGVPGKELVLKDRPGHVVSHLQCLRKPHEGHDLVLSIDQRLQYLAFRALQNGIARAHAKSGSVVMLDVRTGEVLAMVNLPTYNPNQRPRPKSTNGCYRNRAVTDIFEPGSTMKAFSIASALESGRYKPSFTVNTSPGWFMVDGNRIIDEHLNYGVITVAKVLEKSSNIGTVKLTLSLTAERLVGFLERMGFGERTGSQFPGEAAGILPHVAHWKPFELATLSFGYRLAVTTLQLARAYAILVSGGVQRPLTFLKRTGVAHIGRRSHDDHAGDGRRGVEDEGVGGVVAGSGGSGKRERRVMRAQTAQQMVVMLTRVVEGGGTGYRARVPGYRVAGKTGTAYIAGPKGYDKHRYVASFVGMAPAEEPRFVLAVVVREPDMVHHYGGVVAAPIFSKIMAGALRLFEVPVIQHLHHYRGHSK